MQLNIIQELGLQDLPEDKQGELLAQMTEALLKRMTVQILEKLSDEKVKEFDALQGSGDPEKVTAFLRANIPDYDAMLEQTVKEFKEEMKHVLESVK